MADTPFCVFCGRSHVFGTNCDPAWLDWVATRRKEIAAGVPWQDATPMPQGRETAPGEAPLGKLARLEKTVRSALENLRRGYYGDAETVLAGALKDMDNGA